MRYGVLYCVNGFVDCIGESPSPKPISYVDEQM